MPTGNPPIIPIITTSCRLYARILESDHVIITTEAHPPEAAPNPYFTTRQCILSRPDERETPELLLKMVGG